MKMRSNKKQRIKTFDEIKSHFVNMLSYFREYPDHFIDYISPPKCKIKLHFYQRVWLRVLFRYQKVYIVATRGTAKSFTNVLAQFLWCMMYPDTKLSIIAPQKNQATNIAISNIENILNFFPILNNEIKEYKKEKDYTRVKFHNGSEIDVIPLAEGTRGLRRHGLSFEEIVDPRMDEKKDEIASVILPLMANSRITANGVDPNEVHKRQIYITTAGTKQSYAFEKLMEIYTDMLKGKSAFAFGSSYELPVMHNQLDLSYINDLKEQATFNPLIFAREYQSVFTGSSDNSLVQLEDLRACRTLTRAEFKASNKDKASYILSYDVARSERESSANSSLCVIKIIPRGDGTYSKHVVNILAFKGNHFKEQALMLKKLVNQYKASMLVIDANGLGKGLVDFLVTEIDENPPYEVVNDDSYKQFKTSNSIPMIFSISSNKKETNASDIHNVFMNIILNHDVKLLVNESKAREGAKVEFEKLEEYLLPYRMTDFLQEEIMNLVYKQSGMKTTVEQVSKGINKDRFSALEYGLFYIHNLEKKNKVRGREVHNALNFFMSKRANIGL